MDSSVRERAAYAFGSFRLDAARRLLTRGGEPVALTPTVFDTLLYLVENPGRVVTKEELLDAIWPRRVVEDSNVSQTIFTLRKALNGPGEEGRFIVTAPGRGYRFTAAVRLDLGAPPQPMGRLISWPRGVSQAGSAAPPVIRPAWWRRRPWATAAAVGVAVLTAAAIALLTRPLGAAHVPGERSVLVLADFRNLTGEAIFDRSLGQALEIGLDQSPSLAVLPDQQVQDTLVLMTRPKDQPMTPALAEEVCARNGGGAVMYGSIAALGAQYLLTLNATDCAGEHTLVAEKAQVGSREAVVPALDRLIRRARTDLGESIRSVRKFDVPLLPEKTASLPALKAYSEGVWLYGHGRRADSIPMFQHAIELDPNFAAAYADLSSVYYSLNQENLDAANISKAYALRDTVSEREKFAIVARYNESVTKDLDETIRNLQVWSETYPQDAAPWTRLANAENWVGRYGPAIEAGQQAVALNPGRETAYVVLARAYLHAGQIDRAAAISAQAVAKGVAGDDIHSLLMRIAFARQDAGGVAREMAWARGKPQERGMLLIAAQDAFSGGEVRRGEDLFGLAVGLGKTQGLGDFTLAPRARWLTDFGLNDRARVLLSKVPAGFDSADYRFTMAEIGDGARAGTLLRRDLAQSASDTLLNDVYAPEVRAALALRRGGAVEAVEALRPALPYEARSFDIPYLRGLAYLAAGDGPRASAEFHKILDHQGVDTVSPLFALARLGAARADRLVGNRTASRRDYESFFAAWRHADPDLPILEAARAEYAHI